MLSIAASLFVIPSHVRSVDAQVTTLAPIKLSPRALAVQIATQYGLSVPRFLATIRCESGWNPKAKGDYRKGKPTSFGLTQLHNPEKDWGLTVEQAEDPVIALEVMAKAWKRNEQWRWSCYT